MSRPASRAEIRKQTAELVRAVEALHHTEKELEERTAWALRLQEEAAQLEEQVTLYRASRWVKLGRKVGLGPVYPTVDMALLKRVLRALPLLVLSPLLLAISALALWRSPIC